MFRPAQHKDAQCEPAREIRLGPKAQAILTYWLRWDQPQVFTFSRRASSRSPRSLADRYEVEEYRRAVQCA